MERHKSKPEDEQLIYDESADMVDREGAVFRLAVDGYNEMQPLLEKFLVHPQYMLRSRAIKVLLGGWGLEKYFNKAVEMLHSDTDYSVRSGAVFALSQYFQNFESGYRSQNKIIEQLLKSLIQDDETAVQESSYEGLLKIFRQKRLVIKGIEFNRAQDVDWMLLQPYLDKYNLSKPV